MATVTLVGERLAEVGREFVYRGEADGCDGCPYRSQCLNLVDGRRYQITELRDNAQLLDCALHDIGVRAVEVKPAPITANVASQKAYAGRKTKLEGPCPYTECPSHEYCVPDGVDLDTEYQITSVKGEPPHDYCQLDRDLKLVEIEDEIK